ncbi:phosphatidate cytidylyltransferase [Rubinisphaera sp.]|uniref:phosphatidate cytidylyltransferase n=1 Tax=Rubinisphaera sp. TaxID=2024857 RepID=UPI000C0D85A1|nr:phosphatidate cytidylyltransferase [Rubinisphaera sp.]MBV11478.1 phosphatidate cytidylyltransferase [Rubinisphaera sp.]HCS52903.1 phosphatidate cytidylyltransferase [Planctomycetaceae bacterium]|tara:strand:+ start:3251 stop:4189 length:939 start_codon:yes stop_codon:yes gene_type:complete
MQSSPAVQPAKKGRNLRWRLIISAILISSLGTLFYFDHKIGRSAPVLLLLCLFLAIRGSWEMTNLLKTRSFQPKFLLVAMGSVSIILATWLKPLGIGETQGVDLSYLGPTMLTFSLVMMALFMMSALRFREPGQSMETLSAEIMIVVYVGVFLSMTAQLRWVAGPQAGYLVLGSLIVAAKGGDVGAYTLGKLLGRKKLNPILSPGKTWWGARGALIASAFFSWLWLTYMPPVFNPNWEACPWPLAILYGIVVAIVGMLGDLCESLIKRDVGKKDSAPLMPGFGGILDILDSVLYTGPVAYLFWSLFPMASWV